MAVLVAVRLFFGVGLLAALAAPAAADRQVAIVNLATDQAAGAEIARDLRDKLKKHRSFDPIAPGTLSRALEGALPARDPDAVVLDEARQALEGAESELERFRNKVALSRVRAAFGRALGAHPGPAQAAALAELAFLEGRIELREQNLGNTREAFELAIRLAPSRPPPDPSLFNPTIVELYEQARGRAATPPSVAVTVVATYDDAEIFVDGRRVGTSPLRVKLAPGLHVIAATRPGYAVAARRVEAGEGAPVHHTLELSALDREAQAQRARRLALTGRDFAAAARAAAAIARVEAAIVVSDGDDGFEYALCCTPDGRLTAYRSASAEVGQLLSLLVPVTMPLAAFELPEVATERPPWYERPGPMAGLVGGAVIASVAVVLMTIAGDDGERLGTCCSFSLSP